MISRIVIQLYTGFLSHCILRTLCIIRCLSTPTHSWELMKLLGSPGRLPLSICDEGGDGLIACESCSPGYDCIIVIGPQSVMLSAQVVGATLVVECRHQVNCPRREPRGYLRSNLVGRSKERTTWVPQVKPCGKVEQQSVVTRDAKSVNHLGKT
jgi:hypothetical protein